eukprot:NODE_101_length_19951_cov_0.932501.p15 type:complete len:134 gc:universal NODE_101_length_19951_cov_0.932501:9314-9715(+)
MIIRVKRKAVESALDEYNMGNKKFKYIASHPSSQSDPKFRNALDIQMNSTTLNRKDSIESLELEISNIDLGDEFVYDYYELDYSFDLEENSSNNISEVDYPDESLDSDLRSFYTDEFLSTSEIDDDEWYEVTD